MTKTIEEQLKPLATTAPPLMEAKIISIPDGEGQSVETYVRVRVSDTTWQNYTSLRDPSRLLREVGTAVRIATGDNTWSIRYASQVTQQNLPFLHSSMTRRVIIDPLQPYRVAAMHMYQARELMLTILPSQAYYFKSLDEAKRVTARLEQEGSKNYEGVTPAPLPVAAEQPSSPEPAK